MAVLRDLSPLQIKIALVQVQLTQDMLEIRRCRHVFLIALATLDEHTGIAGGNLWTGV